MDWIEPELIEQIHHALRSMPSGTEIEQRGRAAMAFTLLSGARDDTVASMWLENVDVLTGTVVQDARQVRTKAGKTITSVFFPVGEEVREIVNSDVPSRPRRPRTL